MCWFGGIEKETTAVLRAPVSWAMWICVVFGANIHLSIARHLPSYFRVLWPNVPYVSGSRRALKHKLALIRRWSSTIVIVIAATWWIERSEGEKDSRAKNSCLRLVHRKWQKTHDRVTALRRTVTPQTLSVFVLWLERWQKSRDRITVTM